MSTFFMFGKYSSGAVQHISSQRTAKAREVVQRLGGRVRDIYALLGEYDLVIIADLPNMAEAMRASLELKKLTDITFFTVAAMPVDQFDEIFGG